MIIELSVERTRTEENENEQGLNTWRNCRTILPIKRRLDFHFVEKERSLENVTGGVVFSMVISPDEKV